MTTAADFVRKFKNLKTLPHVGIKLSQLISDENVTIQQLEEVIRLDPTLVLRILKLINSPYYGLREKVTSISQAVVYIGMENLRNMVVVAAMKEIFKQTREAQAFSRNRLWLHCAVVGLCAQMIAERIFQQKGEDPFLCGILHDIGMIVEDQVEPDLFLKACQAFNAKERPIVEDEKEILGADHATIGRLLAKDWKLPPDVAEGIGNHHKIMDKVEPTSLSGIIQIAEYMTAKLEYTAMPGTKVVLSPPLLAHIGKSLTEYKTLLRDLPEEVAKAIEIYQLDEEES